MHINKENKNLIFLGKESLILVILINFNFIDIMNKLNFNINK